MNNSQLIKSTILAATYDLITDNLGADSEAAEMVEEVIDAYRENPDWLKGRKGE